MRERRLIRYVAAAALLLATILYWQQRVLARGTRSTIDLGIVDLYTEHMPVMRYGFQELTHGRIPLWNPYQLCGTPFLAMGWSGLFYPGHVPYLVLDVPTALELSFVLHMFLGAFGMWAVARRFGSGVLGAGISGVTFVWSAWVTHHVNAPAVFESMAWMPLIVLALDGVALGRRRAWLALIGALTCQLLIGMVEIVLHTAYLGAAFLVCRLVVVGRETSGRTVLYRAGAAVAAAIAALGLSMPNTLPLVELVQQSTRAAGALSLVQAINFGSLPAPAFLRGALAPSEWAWTGVLPLVALPLALALRRGRPWWVGSVLVGAGAASLVFGGLVFEWYFRLPIVGGLFRRPMKFLDLYVFAAALLVGAAVTWLQREADSASWRLWRHPAWLATIAGAAAVVSTQAFDPYTTGLVAALALFGLVPVRGFRHGLVAIVCLLHAASLFFTTGDDHIRPVRRPKILDLYDALLVPIAAQLDGGRLYLSPDFLFLPGLTHKQGTLRRMNTSVDYEPLATERYGRFFTTAAPDPEDAMPFSGKYPLTATSNWKLMDLTATRFYVMLANEPGERYMSAHPEAFALEKRTGPARVYRRTTPGPRASVVARAHIVASAEEALRAITAPTFDPRTEVVLEAPANGSDVTPPGATGVATIASEKPEHIEVSAHTDTPGFLVLRDLFYPGWRAFVGDREVPILRADYLFRAVRIDAGTTVVRFEYRPASFALGVAIALFTAATVAAIAIASRRRGRVNPSAG